MILSAKKLAGLAAAGCFVALLSACAGSGGSAVSPADAAPAPAVIELTLADVQRPGQQFWVGRQLRGVSLRPFIPQSHAYDSVRKQAAKIGASQILVTWSGERQEDNGGIGGVYFVVEAVAVQWVPFTPHIAMGILGLLAERHPLEVQSMLYNMKNSGDPVYATYLLFSIKNGGAARYLPSFTETYAALSGPSAIPELTKLLRYHANESVRIEAGHQLVLLGQGAEVDAAAATDRSPHVQAALRQMLLR